MARENYNWSQILRDRVQYFIDNFCDENPGIPCDLDIWPAKAMGKQRDNGILDKIKLTSLIFLMESDTRMAIIVIFRISTYKLMKLEYYDGV